MEQQPCSYCPYSPTFLLFSIHKIRRRRWHPTPVLWPGESHGRRSMVGCGPWGRWVGHDWATSFSLFTFMIGEGNDNPLQCSCLENPRDGGAWWAAVYGFAQSWTWLKRLSSSSSSNSSHIHMYIYIHTYMCVCVCVSLPSWASLPHPLSSKLSQSASLGSLC